MTDKDASDIINSLHLAPGWTINMSTSSSGGITLHFYYKNKHAMSITKVENMEWVNDFMDRRYYEV